VSILQPYQLAALARIHLSDSWRACTISDLMAINETSYFQARVCFQEMLGAAMNSDSKWGQKNSRGQLQFYFTADEWLEIAGTLKNYPLFKELGEQLEAKHGKDNSIHTENVERVSDLDTKGGN